jgi:predicted nucleic acid-binding protein
MLFDTDIIIWIQRANKKAAELVDADPERCISILTYMELLQNAKNQQHHTVIKSYLKDLNFTILPLSENVGHRASIYVEEYSLSSGMSADDALIASTAIETNLLLVSGNHKHFKSIKDLQLKKFTV